MRLENPRIAPLEESECGEEQRELLARAQVGGRVLNIFRTLVRHPKLLKRWMVFGNHVLNKSTLDPREREILILRIGWLCRSEYEWGQHVAIGKRGPAGKGSIPSTPCCSRPPTNSTPTP
jgi:alkylhydroperoxidase family enzyme